MPSITLTLNETEITTAIKDYVENLGYLTSDRFSITVIPPENAHEWLSASITGVFIDLLNRKETSNGN